MARQLRVQHWVACLEAEVVPPAGPNNFYNLLRAGYVHQAPADTEFPWSLPRLEMFARFIGGRGAADFEIRMLWVDAPRRARTVETFGPWRVSFRPGEPTRDVVFRLRNVPIEGPGRYGIELRSVAPGKRKRLAIEYLSVVSNS
jgi:hypothetical protein